ncbi:MAG TPA: MFS transporter [Candidatus Angelobacter sp.]|nr:MFS transporter [Candidatus Angelobacter sp.]
MSGQSSAQGQSLVAFQYPDFGLYQLARLFTVMATEMQSVAVGWQVFEITRRPLDLGYVGLAQFWPTIVLFLVAGHAADRFNRRNIVTLCYAGLALSSTILFVLTITGSRSVHSIYAALTLVGVVRAFNGAAGQSMVPQLVPEEHFPNAVAWAQTVFNAAVILGPALGGFIYAAFHGPAVVYGCSTVAGAISVVVASRITLNPAKRQREAVSIETVLAGLRFIWEKKLVLGSISLDLFAVLLGGATALLPVYARDILHTGPWGLGILRSAPAVGAALTAVLLAHRPLRRHAGTTMLWCVAGFGVFTIVFGLSRNIYLSLLALLLLGASDMVSVVIRGTLVQLSTPDAMRGRVSAVNSLFIGTSNEFGQFESGVTAQWFGAVPAVVIGGVGTLVVIALWVWLFPELRGADRLANQLEPQEHETP